jgi:hypothetical protein
MQFLVQRDGKGPMITALCSNDRHTGAVIILAQLHVLQRSPRLAFHKGKSDEC